MTTSLLNPIAAFDVVQGRAQPFAADFAQAPVAADYRWLHLDLNDPAVRPWAQDNLPDIAARALCQSETRPRCERLADGLILNLRGVNLNPDADPEDMVSLRMWITKDTVISARLRKVWAVDDIRQTAQNGTAPATAGRLLADIAYGLTTRIESVSIDLEDQTDALEETILDGQMLQTGQIGTLRQTVIKMRRFVNPQREAIATLASLEGWIIAPDELALLRETSNRTRRIVEELDATRDRLSALQDHIDAHRTHALSRNGYVLSVVAAIFLPLGFLTGLFGVNVGGMPGVDAPMAFWILTGASVISGIALYLIFKYAKWL